MAKSTKRRKRSSTTISVALKPGVSYWYAPTTTQLEDFWTASNSSGWVYPVYKKRRRK